MKLGRAACPTSRGEPVRQVRRLLQRRSRDHDHGISFRIDGEHFRYSLPSLPHSIC